MAGPGGCGSWFRGGWHLVNVGVAAGQGWCGSWSMWVLQLVQVGVTASPSGCCSWSKWLWQPVHMGVVAGPSGIFVYVYMCVYVWEVQQKNSYIYYKMMTGQTHTLTVTLLV